MRFFSIHIGTMLLILIQFVSLPTASFAQEDSTHTYLQPKDTLSNDLLPDDSLVSVNTDTSEMTDTSSVFMQDLIHFVRVGFGVATVPLTFDSQDWHKVGFSIAGMALLFTVDKLVKQWALHNQNKTDDFLFYLDHYYGKGYSLIFTWGLYGYGALVGNEKLRKLGRNATEAFVFSGAITGAIKLLVGRRRPYAGDNHLFFHPFQFSNDDYQAMPSGHTTVSFAVSTVMAKSVDNIYWKIFWYGSAAMVGASRIYHNKHWLSDVAVGAMIGYSVGSYVVNYDRRHAHNLLSSRFQPYFGLGRFGLVYQF